MEDHLWGSKEEIFLQGILFARQGGKSEEAMLMWRPFQGLYANSEWTLTLQSQEQIQAIAAGKSFLAVATSHNQLRLLTTAGTLLPPSLYSGRASSRQASGPYNEDT